MHNSAGLGVFRSLVNWKNVPAELPGSQSRVLDISGKKYETEIFHATNLGKDAPKLLIVSYAPDRETARLLQACIRSILRFTPEAHEIWVIDNGSPAENISWLYDLGNINIVLNKTPIDGGSEANGVALDIAAQVIPQDSRYVMTLHQDVVFCKTGWLSYLLSKFDNKVKVVGTRLDKKRVSEGVAHVLGMMIDFQMIREEKISFLPQLPNLDTGDAVSVRARELGYEVYSTPNSLWDVDALGKLSLQNVYQQVTFDRSVDDTGDVFFMHLGRGVLKSTGYVVSKDKSKETWFEFIESNVFN
jgi:hypothetical protein